MMHEIRKIEFQLDLKIIPYFSDSQTEIENYKKKNIFMK